MLASTHSMAFSGLSMYWFDATLSFRRPTGERNGCNQSNDRRQYLTGGKLFHSIPYPLCAICERIYYTQPHQCFIYLAAALLASEMLPVPPRSEPDANLWGAISYFIYKVDAEAFCFSPFAFPFSTFGSMVLPSRTLFLHYLPCGTAVLSEPAIPNTMIGRHFLPSDMVFIRAIISPPLSRGQVWCWTYIQNIQLSLSSPTVLVTSCIRWSLMGTPLSFSNNMDAFSSDPLGNFLSQICCCFLNVILL